ncbi:MAG: hypothetical protein ABW352_22615 [Polyangiales bacterium]
MLLWVGALSGCEPFAADPNGPTQVELTGDLTTAQVVAVHNAVLEVNMAVGREVFIVRGDHFGRRGRVTINAARAPKGYDAYTHMYPSRAEINLGATDDQNMVVHELIHVILGGEHAHSQDPADVFFPRVRDSQTITTPTVIRMQLQQGMTPEP